MVSTCNAVTCLGVVVIGLVCYINVKQLQSMGQHSHVIRAAATAYLPPKPLTFGAGTRVVDLDLDGALPL